MVDELDSSEVVVDQVELDRLKAAEIIENWSRPRQRREVRPFGMGPEDDRKHIDAETIVNMGRTKLIGEILKRVENDDFVPELAECKNIMCKFVLGARQREISSMIFDDPEEDELLNEGADLPWVGVDGEQNISLDWDGVGYEVESDERDVETIKVGKTSVVDGFFSDYENYGDGLADALILYVNKMNLQDRVEFSKWTLDNIDSLYPMISSDVGIEWKFFDIMYAGIDWREGESLDFGDHLVKFLLERGGESGYIQLKGEKDYGDVNYVNWGLFGKVGGGERKKLLFRTLAEGDYSQEDKLRILRIITRQERDVEAMVFPRLMNELRDMLRGGDLTGDSRNKVENLLRWYLGGLDQTLPAHLSLDEVYRHVFGGLGFDVYEVSRETVQKRMRWLKKVFGEFGIKRKVECLVSGVRQVVCDLACGTGWLTKDLVREGYDVVGIDADENNLSKASSKYPDELGGPDVLVQGNWEEMPFDRGELAAVICMGRSLPHTESWRGFHDAIVEISRVVRADGVFIFDLPNLKKGSYREANEKYKEFLLRQGFNRGELARFPYVVDSPDRVNYFNRYVPDEGTVVHELLNAGFWVERIEYEDIPEQEGNENVVYICRKMNAEEIQKYNKIKSGGSAGVSDREEIFKAIPRLDRTRNGMSG